VSMGLCSGEAVVLRTRSYRENDLLVTLFFKEHGKVTGVARGAKRSRKRFGGLLMPLHALDVHYKETSNSSLISLREASMVRSFSGIRQSLDALMAGTYILDVVSHFSEEREPNSSLYGTIIKTLEQFSETSNCEPILRRFEWNCLEAVGFRPELSHCVECRNFRPPEKGGIFYFARGGILCRQCRPSFQGGVSLSSETINRLINGEALNNESVIGELQNFLPSFITYQLGKPLPSAAVLSEIKKVTEGSTQPLQEGW